VGQVDEHLLHARFKAGIGAGFPIDRFQRGRCWRTGTDLERHNGDEGYGKESVHGGYPRERNELGTASGLLYVDVPDGFICRIVVRGVGLRTLCHQQPTVARQAVLPIPLGQARAFLVALRAVAEIGDWRA
jgi:hypothetical protein